jgi:hypothetical protein
LVFRGLGLVAAPLFGSLGAGLLITGVTVQAVGAIEGATFRTTVVAIGEGAVVRVGALGGGSSTSIALATLAGPVG